MYGWAGTANRDPNSHNEPQWWTFYIHLCPPMTSHQHSPESVICQKPNGWANLLQDFTMQALKVQPYWRGLVITSCCMCHSWQPIVSLSLHALSSQEKASFYITYVHSSLGDCPTSFSNFTLDNSEATFPCSHLHICICFHQNWFIYHPQIAFPCSHIISVSVSAKFASLSSISAVVLQRLYRLID